MNIAKTTRLFFFFLFLFLSGFSGILFQGFSVIILSDRGESLYFLNGVYPLIALTIALLYALPKINRVIAFFGSAILAFCLAYGGKHAYRILFNVPLNQLADDISVGIFVVPIFLLSILLLLIILPKVDTITKALDSEKDFGEKDKYLEYINGLIGGRERFTDSKWFISLSTNVGLILVVIAYFTVVREEQAKWLDTFYLLFYAYGGVGIYLLLNQFNSAVKWKMNGYKIPEHFSKNWNKIILFYLIPIILVPLIIPWNFKVFDNSGLSERINQSLTGVTIDIARGQTNRIGLTNQVVSNTNTSTTITVKRDPKPQGESIDWIILRTVLWSLAIAVSIYILLGLVGGLIYLKYRYAKKGKFVQFMIGRYYGLKGIVDLILSFFLIIFRFITGIFGVGVMKGSKQNRELAHPVGQQLFSLFQANKEMTDEKKEEILTIIKQFVNLIQIASKYATPYYYYYGPLEYTEKLAENRPELRNRLKEIVGIFNESRYSLHLLSESKKELFKEDVDFTVTELTK